MAAGIYLYGSLIVAGGIVAVSMLLDEAPEPETKAAVESGAFAPEARREHDVRIASAGNGVGLVELQRAADNNFYTDAQVNGTSVRFLVDPNAAVVVLTRADAQRTGLLGGDFSVQAITPNGQIGLQPITIARLGLGPATAEHVTAMVADEGALAISVLGQSYLARLGDVTVEGNRMVLR